MSFGRLWPGALGVYRPADIPANAKPKGNHRLCGAEEVPKFLWLYLAFIPRTRIVELYAQRALC